MRIDETHKGIRKIFEYPDRPLSSPVGGKIKFHRDRFGVLFKHLGFNVGAEIGVRRGGFTVMLCKANPDLKMFCIDPWMEVPRYSAERQNGIYLEAVKNLRPYNVTIIKDTSMNALRRVEDRSLDFIHIDGDHTFDFVVMDIIHWAKKVKTGGIIACHDYHPAPGNGVREAIDAYTHAHSIFPWYVTKETQPTAFWVNP